MAPTDYTTAVQLDLFLTPPSEEWRAIVGWEGYYQVSNLGRIRSCTRRVLLAASARRGPTWRTIQSQILSGTTGGKRSPYRRLHLWREDSWVLRSVHHLVLEAFVGPKPPRAVANHIDGDKDNNCVTNLEWCSRSRNNRHAIETGLVRIRGEEHFGHKYTEADVLEMRRLRREGWGLRDIAQYFDAPLGSVHNIVRRKTWKHLP